MSVPLATLRRQSVLAWLHDPLALPLPPTTGEGPQAARLSADAAIFDVRYGRRMSFLRADDALHWLGFWRYESGALLSLRSALQRVEASAPVFLWSDERVLALLAGLLANGRVVATESKQPPEPAILPAAPAAAPAAAEPPAVSVSALAAPPAPEAPILPILEEVQIEGAEVLPEIEQSLEQVNISIGEIKLAPLSLEPTPSKVPDISASMSATSSGITATLDGL